MNTYTKLLVDLANMDVVIEEKKSLDIIKLSSQRGIWELCTYLDKWKNITYLCWGHYHPCKSLVETKGHKSTEALIVRERSLNQRENHGKSKLKSRYGNSSLTRDQCILQTDWSLKETLSWAQKKE